MPYPRAHYFLLIFLCLAILAFWPRYFSTLHDAPFAFHFHGVTGVLWILLLTFRSWSIHNGHRAHHRLAGKMSLLLFPPFLIGMLFVLQTLGKTVASGQDPVFKLYGAGLGAIDWLVFFAVSWLYYSALKHRKNIHIHARCMLATPLLLINPIAGRLMEFYIPALMIKGPEDFSNFATATLFADIIALLVTLALYVSNRKMGQPFLFVACAIVLGMIGFHLVGPTDWWTQLFVCSTSWPTMVYALLGLVFGISIIWLGWSKPKK